MTMLRTTLALPLAFALVTAASCRKEATTDTPITVTPATPGGDPNDPNATADAKTYPDPPPPSERKAVNLPETKSFQLSNGLTVYLVRNDEVPTVTAQLVVKCGAVDDEYVAPFTAAMLGEGTSARTKAKIDEAIEFVGGRLGSGAGLHTSTVWSHALAKDAKLAIVLMADEALNPTFPAPALEKLKQQAKTGISVAKSQPDVLASVLFDHVVYPKDHPYGRMFPTPAQIDAITTEDIRKFHATYYQPSNAYLILAGDLDMAQAKTLAQRGFGKWAKGNKELPPNPLNEHGKYAQPKTMTVHIVDRPSSAQTEVRVGNLALARNHADWVALAVANAVLGDDASGRLFTDLREDKGLTYGIYSDVEEGQAPGTFVIETQTRTEATGEMLTGILGHVGRMRADDPSDAEFDKAKQKLAGRFPLQIETSHQMADKLRDVLEYALPTDYWRGYWDEFAKVQSSDVRRVARKYMHPTPNVVLVGDAKAIRPQIEKALPKAKIVLYNTELEPVK
jgi:predicted Zn-dependent peptidase